MNRSHGFTLVELMITLLLAAIIMSLAVPGFGDLMRGNRAATQANELVAALNLARSEAVKRGARVSACPSTNQATCANSTDWATGWIVFVDLAANDGAAPVVQDPVLRAWGALAGGGDFEGPTWVRYRPLGDVDGTSLPPPPARTFEHRVSGCRHDQGRDIFINAAGQVRVVRVDC